MTGRPTDRIEHLTPEERRFPANMSFNGKDDYCFPADNLPIPEAEPVGRVSRQQLLELSERLTPRDNEILISLKYAKYLMTGQLQRLHIPEASTKTAATRATIRVMRKLNRYGLVRTFKRRIGGAYRGSSSFVWHITEAGLRLLDIQAATETPARKTRYLEPSYIHMRHTLAIAECYVQLVELSRKHKQLVFAAVEWEPNNWRPYTHDGHSLQLKPDLFVVTYNGGFEDRWFIEVDLSTEALPVVLDKCKRYYQYFQTGIEQREHGIFPITIWVVPDVSRKQKLINGIADQLGKAAKMFLVITLEELPSTILNGAG